MDARTSYTDKDAQVPTGPSWMFVPLAIRADLVTFELDKGLEGLSVLGRPVGRRPSRHQDWVKVL